MFTHYILIAILIAVFLFLLKIIYQGFIYYVDRYADFVLTKDLYQEVTHDSPMFGLDCEMCRTTSGELEVTRVSIVNEELEVSASLCTSTTPHICKIFSYLK
jgi:hypothetical protein